MHDLKKNGIKPYDVLKRTAAVPTGLFLKKVLNYDFFNWLKIESFLFYFEAL